MKHLAWLLLLPFSVHATDFVCTAKKVGRYELIEAYQGRPILIGNQFLTVYMLPANNPDTIAAFSELGISPATAERIAKTGGLVDRYVRITTPDQILIKVEQNTPSAGYVPILLGAKNAQICR